MINGKPSILFVLEHYPPYIGGVEKLFGQITKSLVKRGIDVTVITTQHSRELPLNEITDGIRVKRIKSFNRYLFTLFALPVVIRHASRCNLIHTTTYNAAIPAFIAGRLCRTRVVITVHELWGKLWLQFPWMGAISGWLHYRFEKCVMKLRYDHLIAVSGFTAQALEKTGIRPEKISVIYNGIDYDEIAKSKVSSPPERRQQPHFIYYGRLGYSKGIDLIIPAAGMFLERHPDAIIELILPLRPVWFRRRIERMVKATGYTKSIIITDSLPVRKLFARLQEATAVLIPSRSEGFCFAAAETAALDIPVISSNKGALTETTGGKVIVMKESNAESLCDAMESAIRGEWEIKPVKMFPLEEQVNAYLGLYERLLNS